MSGTQDAKQLVDSWFSTNANISMSLEPATAAYKEALALFESRFPFDDKSQKWLQGKHTMVDVQRAVDQAKRQYELKSKPSKARLWLQKLAQRIVFYGVVFDTLVQGAPEYASLGWGAMKFLFMVVVNQAELVSKLAKALAAIADVLPHIELRTILYPTEKMKLAVAKLYANIMQFTMRAARWYTESKIKHALGSMLKPFALSFQDILDEISSTSREVDALAVSASMAEQRIMHLGQKDSHQLLVDMNITLRAFQKQSLASTLDTNKRVCDIQFSQILTFTSDPKLSTPEMSRKTYQAMRNQRQRRMPRAIKTGHQDIQVSARFQSWALSHSPSLIIIRGSFSTRHLAKDFAINTIDKAMNSKVPTVWMLKPPSGEKYRDPQITDILKQLVLQILRLNHTMLDERSLTLSASRFQSATTEQEWFNILGSVLDGLDQLYIIIDVECLSSIDSCDTVNFSWLKVFHDMFQELENHAIKTEVKVVLVNYLQPLNAIATHPDSVIHLAKMNSRDKVSRSRVARSDRKAGR